MSNPNQQIPIRILTINVNERTSNGYLFNTLVGYTFDPEQYRERYLVLPRVGTVNDFKVLGIGVIELDKRVADSQRIYHFLAFEQFEKPWEQSDFLHLTSEQLAFSNSTERLAMELKKSPPEIVQDIFAREDDFLITDVNAQFIVSILSGFDYDISNSIKEFIDTANAPRFLQVDKRGQLLLQEWDAINSVLRIAGFEQGLNYLAQNIYKSIRTHLTPSTTGMVEEISKQVSKSNNLSLQFDRIEISTKSNGGSNITRSVSGITSPVSLMYTGDRIRPRRLHLSAYYPKSIFSREGCDLIVWDGKTSSFFMIIYISIAPLANINEKISSASMSFEFLNAVREAIHSVFQSKRNEIEHDNSLYRLNYNHLYIKLCTSLDLPESLYSLIEGHYSPTEGYPDNITQLQDGKIPNSLFMRLLNAKLLGSKQIPESLFPKLLERVLDCSREFRRSLVIADMGK